MNIFAFENYREYLKELFDYFVTTHGHSFRELATKCSINSSSYLQQIVKNKRNITLETGRKIALGFNLSEMETKYFLLMIDLHDAKSSEEQDLIQEKMLRIKQLQYATLFKDMTIYTDWCFGVILELLRTKKVFTKAEIIAHFSGILTAPKVEGALQHMANKGYIECKNNVYSLPSIPRFAPSGDDKINIDLRSIHEFFLNIGKMRLFLPPKNREYQGVTVAIPKEKIDDLKQKIRAFVGEINEEYATMPDVDTVFHIEVAAFPFFAPNNSDKKE